MNFPTTGLPAWPQATPNATFMPASASEGFAQVVDGAIASLAAAEGAIETAVAASIDPTTAADGTAHLPVTVVTPQPSVAQAPATATPLDMLRDAGQPESVSVPRAADPVTTISLPLPAATPSPQVRQGVSMMALLAAPPAAFVPAIEAVYPTAAQPVAKVSDVVSVAPDVAGTIEPAPSATTSAAPREVSPPPADAAAAPCDALVAAPTKLPIPVQSDASVSATAEPEVAASPDHPATTAATQPNPTPSLLPRTDQGPFKNPPAPVIAATDLPSTAATSVPPEVSAPEPDLVADRDAPTADALPEAAKSMPARIGDAVPSARPTAQPATTELTASSPEPNDLATLETAASAARASSRHPPASVTESSDARTPERASDPVATEADAAPHTVLDTAETPAPAASCPDPVATPAPAGPIPAETGSDDGRSSEAALPNVLAAQTLPLMRTATLIGAVQESARPTTPTVGAATPKARAARADTSAAKGPSIRSIEPSQTDAPETAKPLAVAATARSPETAPRVRAEASPDSVPTSTGDAESGQGYATTDATQIAAAVPSAPPVLQPVTVAPSAHRKPDAAAELPGISAQTSHPSVLRHSAVPAQTPEQPTAKGTPDAPKFAEALPAVAAAPAGPEDSTPVAATISLAEPSQPVPAPSAEPTTRAPAQPSTPVVTAQPGHIGRELGVEIARRVSAGGNELVVRLAPAELGRIEVRMAFDQHGGLATVIAADSPVALDMLRRDSADLTRSLSDAGFRSDGQSLRFDNSGDRGGNGSGQPRSPWSHLAGKPDQAADTAATTDFETPYRPLRTSGRYDLMA